MPCKRDRQQLVAHQGRDDRKQSNTPDFFCVEGKRASGVDAHQQGEDRAQGNQKSISRQDQVAELEELRMHVRDLDETDPLGRNVVRW